MPLLQLNNIKRRRFSIKHYSIDDFHACDPGSHGQAARLVDTITTMRNMVSSNHTSSPVQAMSPANYLDRPTQISGDASAQSAAQR